MNIKTLCVPAPILPQRAAAAALAPPPAAAEAGFLLSFAVLGWFPPPLSELPKSFDRWVLSPKYHRCAEWAPERLIHFKVTQLIRVKVETKKGVVNA